MAEPGTELACSDAQLYAVHMKRVTASDARRNWFRILDEVADGAVVVIERKGRRILIQRSPEGSYDAPVPHYTDLVSAPSASRMPNGGGGTGEAKRASSPPWTPTCEAPLRHALFPLGRARCVPLG